MVGGGAMLRDRLYIICLVLPEVVRQLSAAGLR